METGDPSFYETNSGFANLLMSLLVHHLNSIIEPIDALSCVNLQTQFWLRKLVSVLFSRKSLYTNLEFTSWNSARNNVILSSNQLIKIVKSFKNEYYDFLGVFSRIVLRSQFWLHKVADPAFTDLSTRNNARNFVNLSVIEHTVILMVLPVLFYEANSGFAKLLGSILYNKYSHRTNRRSFLCYFVKSVPTTNINLEYVYDFCKPLVFFIS